jgi:hypothetical protein
MDEATRRLAIALFRAAFTHDPEHAGGYISGGDIAPLYVEQAVALMAWASNQHSDPDINLVDALTEIGNCFPAPRVAAREPMQQQEHTGG